MKYKNILHNLEKWLDYTEKHRVYLKDALDYLHKPKPGNG